MYQRKAGERLAMYKGKAGESLTAYQGKYIMTSTWGPSGQGLQLRVAPEDLLAA